REQRKLVRSAVRLPYSHTVVRKHCEYNAKSTGTAKPADQLGSPAALADDVAVDSMSVAAIFVDGKIGFSSQSKLTVLCSVLSISASALLFGSQELGKSHEATMSRDHVFQAAYASSPHPVHNIEVMKHLYPFHLPLSHLKETVPASTNDQNP